MKPRILVFIFIIIFSTVFYLYYKRSMEEFFYAGTVEATEIDLSSRLNSVLDKVCIREGDKVKKGQKLIALSCEELKVAYDSAEKDYDRAKQLLEAGSMNQEAFDRAKFKRDDIEVRLKWAEIFSPLEGTVLTSYHEEGEWVNVGTRLLTLADLSRVWAYVYVPESTLAKIRLGMKVSGFFANGEETPLTGTIIKINDEAEFTPKNVQTRKERTRLVFGVKIEFENPKTFLKPGMTVEMSLPE